LQEEKKKLWRGECFFFLKGECFFLGGWRCNQSSWVEGEKFLIAAGFKPPHGCIQEIKAGIPSLSMRERSAFLKKIVGEIMGRGSSSQMFEARFFSRKKNSPCYTI
jgi:hypothetical protein